jgi:flagellar biosynthesis anti-sigma factor FlgM
MTMTDPISGLSRSQVQLNPGADKTKSDKTAEANETKSTAPVNDELVLSDATETALANAEFDAEKVAKIKAAIEAGNYPLDAERIAESFASLERMIGSK